MTTFSLSALPQRRSRGGTLAPIAVVATLFWLFSYALFTSRVQLHGDEGMAALLTVRRLLTTAAGALLYAAVLRFAIFPQGRKPAHPLVLIAAVIPAAAAMVGIRVVIDPLVSAAPLPLADHLRWVLVWAGYFGLWLVSFTAWRMHSKRAECASPVPCIAPTLAAASGQPDLVVASRVVLEDLVEVLAEEAARLPEADRQTLLLRLGSDYAVADDPLGTANPRSAIIKRITQRIALPEQAAS